jgi:membrane protein YqaA with SNARE-associated domain
MRMGFVRFTAICFIGRIARYTAFVVVPLLF